MSSCSDHLNILVQSNIFVEVKITTYVKHYPMCTPDVNRIDRLS